MVKSRTVILCDQPGHSRSLIRSFTGRIFDSQGCKCLHVDHEDGSECAVVQFDLCLHLAHMSASTFPHVEAKMIPNFISSINIIQLRIFCQLTHTHFLKKI